MPTASERAAEEARGWDRLTRWSASAVPEVYEDRPARERDVVMYFDPAEDLQRRWSEFDAGGPTPDLDGLARFARDLAEREADAWSRDIPDLAMREYHARRNLLGDRILHWAVPWLEAVGRCYPGHREAAHADRDWLLGIGDEMRVLPAFAHGEGLSLPGEDSFGPVAMREPWTAWIRSLWSGRLMLDATFRSMGCDPGNPGEDVANDLILLYEASAARWRTVARESPGSAGLWNDLAARADRTAAALARIG